MIHRLAASRCHACTVSSACLAMAVVAALAGCAETGETPGWRHARVVQVVPAVATGGAPPAADGRCLAGAGQPAASGATPDIAVVRYRVTRSYYRQAFVVPPDMTPAVGEPVFVRPDTCQMRPRGEAHAAALPVTP